jgi:hypothetical protein
MALLALVTSYFGSKHLKRKASRHHESELLAPQQLPREPASRVLCSRGMPHQCTSQPQIDVRATRPWKQGQVPVQQVGVSQRSGQCTAINDTSVLPPMYCRHTCSTELPSASTAPSTSRLLSRRVIRIPQQAIAIPCWAPKFQTPTEAATQSQRGREISNIRFTAKSMVI